VASNEWRANFIENSWNHWVTAWQAAPEARPAVRVQVERQY
jgi:hypothetical protein